MSSPYLVGYENMSNIAEYTRFTFLKILLYKTDSFQIFGMAIITVIRMSPFRNLHPVKVILAQ